MRQSTGSSEDQNSGQAESGWRDQISKATLRKFAGGSSAKSGPHAAVSAPVSAKRAPPSTSGKRVPGSGPQTWLELIGGAIDDWPRTCRLVVLLVAAALSIGTILFVIQLHADKWISVTAVAASVIAAEGVRRRRNQSRSYRQPRISPDGNDQGPQHGAGSPRRSPRRARPSG